MNTTIHPASAADAELLVPLVEAYWHLDGISGYDREHVHRQLREFASNPGYGRAWLAREGDCVVAYILCTFVYSLEHGGLMAEIDELYVQPSHRRCGIGRRLVAGAQAALSQHGCVALQLQVADGNPHAQSFYTQLGFRPKSGYRLWLAPLQSLG